MVKEYISRILEDGHLFIPEDVVKELDIKSDTVLRIIVIKDDNIKKSNILLYAGLFSDLSKEEERKFNDSIKRRNFFEERKKQI